MKYREVAVFSYGEAEIAACIYMDVSFDGFYNVTSSPHYFVTDAYHLFS